MLKYLILYTSFIAWSYHGYTQTEIQFRLDLITDNSELSVKTLKFYITSVWIQYEDGVTFNESNSYHLIDFEERSTWKIVIPTQNKNIITSVNFNLGTDSLTNISGRFDGDLDPIKGMYWAWNSGYINFKLEGRKSLGAFEFHIGGYLPPYSTCHAISLPIVQTNESIQIDVNLDSFLSSINLSTTNSVLTPGEDASEIARMLSTVFSVHE